MWQSCWRTILSRFQWLPRILGRLAILLILAPAYRVTLAEEIRRTVVASESPTTAQPLSAAALQFNSLKDSLETKARELELRLAQASSTEVRAAARNDLDRLFAAYHKQCLHIAAMVPSDSAALAPLREIAVSAEPESSTALELLAQHHFESKGLVDLALARVFAGDHDTATGKLLNRLAERHANEAVRNRALFGVALWLKNRAERSLEPAMVAQQGRLLAEAQSRFDLVAARGEEHGASSDAGENLSSLVNLAKRESLALKTFAIGNGVPEIDGVDAQGKRFQLSEYRGRVVVVHFFAEWCAVCMARTSAYRKLVRTMPEKDFALVGISLDESPEKLREATSIHNMIWRNVFDGAEGKIARAWNVRHLPQVVVIDRQGIIRFKQLSGPDLEKAVNSLLAEPTPNGTSAH